MLNDSWMALLKLELFSLILTQVWYQKFSTPNFGKKKIQLMLYFSWVEVDSSFWTLIREAGEGFSG